MKWRPYAVLAVGNIGVVIGLGAFALDWLQHRNAEEHVQSYCQGISVGAPIAGLAERAQKGGLHVVPDPPLAAQDGSILRLGSILASERRGFETFRCIVRHDGRTVTAVRATEGHDH